MVVSRTRSQGEYEMPDNITTIGPEIQVRGRIDGEEDLKIEGRVEGNISLTETLFVEAEGIVRADVQARDVVISGIVLGNVTAANSVQLNPGARLVGNISAPRLIIADGAAFAGDVEMGAGDPPVARERSAATRVPARTSRSTRSESALPSRAASSERSSPRVTPSKRRETPAPAARSSAAPSTRSTTSRISRDDDDITVVLKHKDLARGQSSSRASSSEDSGSVEVETRAPKKKKAKKGVRARMPARGKTRSRKR